MRHPSRCRTAFMRFRWASKSVIGCVMGQMYLTLPASKQGRSMSVNFYTLYLSTLQSSKYMPHKQEKGGVWTPRGACTALLLALNAVLLALTPAAQPHLPLSGKSPAAPPPPLARISTPCSSSPAKPALLSTCSRVHGLAQGPIVSKHSACSARTSCTRQPGIFLCL